MIMSQHAVFPCLRCVLCSGSKRVQAPSLLCIQNARYSQKRPTFLSQFLDNVKQDMEKSKQMKESLKKFREEAQKLEQSDALKAARKKFETIEAESMRGGQVFREKVTLVKEKFGSSIQEVQKTETFKIVEELGGELGRKAASAGETLTTKASEVARTATFKSLQEGVKAVQKEVEESAFYRSQVYRAPKVLRRRKAEFSTHAVIQENPDASGMELHKDSKWHASWENFKNNNAYFNKILEMKMKYDESESPVVRASKLLTEKVSDIMGGLFQRTELSEALTEILKADPTFDKHRFLVYCEKEIIPTILEAMIRPELDVLKDWCHEAPYNLLATPIRQALTANCVFASKVLDVDNVDLVMGKVVEQGPILIISFRSQQIMCLKNASSGAVVEGDPKKVLRVNYVWALCRDQNELDPKAAWRLMDLSAQSSEQMM